QFSEVPRRRVVLHADESAGGMVPLRGAVSHAGSDLLGRGDGRLLLRGARDPGAGERLVAVLQCRYLAVLGGAGRAYLAGAVHEDVRAVVGRQVEDRLLPGGQRRLRVAGVEPAHGPVETHEGQVHAVGGRVEGQGVAQHLVAVLVVAEAGEGVALVEGHLT